MVTPTTNGAENGVAVPITELERYAADEMYWVAWLPSMMEVISVICGQFGAKAFLRDDEIVILQAETLPRKIHPQVPRIIITGEPGGIFIDAQPAGRGIRSHIDGTEDEVASGLAVRLPDLCASVFGCRPDVVRLEYDRLLTERGLPVGAEHRSA